MIDVKDVCKSYHSKKGVTYPALNGVTMQVREGQLTALVGVSGAGKSTLLHILACIENYDRGSVQVDGMELKYCKDEEQAQYRNEKIGIVLQNFALLPDFSVFENITLPLHFSHKKISRKTAREKVEAVAETVGILPLMNKSISEISGDEKQRGAIARALVNTPAYIFADEPTGALDSANTQTIVQVFRDISKTGVGVLIATHDPLVSQQCDAVWKIRDGQITEITP